MPAKRKKNNTPPKRSSKKAGVIGLPEDIKAIRAEIARFFNIADDQGRKIGNAKYGVYAFYDYDREPIYVGQTAEKLRGRISRHLTNQRTDAVAMFVLDPFEVAEIEIWPLIDQIKTIRPSEYKEYLNRAEYTVFQKVLRESVIGAILNEKEIAPRNEIALPKSYRRRIIPDSVYGQRLHPDVRIARRASTIASLARVISERNVSSGLRRTLLTQARRLELLASQRTRELGITADYKKK